MDFEFKQSYNVDDLVKIMDLLRGENGCPWDREQTHKSIRKNFIEEVYEVCEAIDLEDTELLKEELGDVLLQVIFHSKMEKEKANFDFDDVADGICKKLIVRHPHIFAEKSDGLTASQVLSNWEDIKNKTKGTKTVTERLDNVPNVLPALMRAQKVQSRAEKGGFCYPDVSYAMADLLSEVAELARAMAENDKQGCKEELGDLLFSCVNVSRFLSLDSEEALTASTDKFIGRVSRVEELAKAQHISTASADIKELDTLWEKAKKEI